MEDAVATYRKALLMYKMLVIIGDSEMVDVNMRKALVFCFVIRMRDDGVGAEEIIMRR